MVDSSVLMFGLFGEIPVAPVSLDEALQVQRVLSAARVERSAPQFLSQFSSPVLAARFQPDLVWGDDLDALVRRVASVDSYRNLLTNLRIFKDSRLPVSSVFRSGYLLGVLWHPKVLSGQWKVHGLGLRWAAITFAILDLPISDVMLSRLLMSDPSLLAANFLCSDYPRRGFVTPPELLVQAALLTPV